MASFSSARKSTPLDISTMEGIDLLSPAEIELCTGVRLTPSQYMTIKVRVISIPFSLCLVFLVLLRKVLSNVVIGSTDIFS